MSLGTIDLAKTLSEDIYKKDLFEHQLRVHAFTQRLAKQKRTAVVLFEGWDAAGKGGAIRRLTERLDPRAYIAHAIAAPAGEDKTHHYLYRFWRRLPERGQLAIFDRSWYGRVLVERVEGFCPEEAWQRAFSEINEFEAQLERAGATLVKCWLHISKEEQLRRFEERASRPLKSWKLTPEDWRNREKWDIYTAAIDDMLQKTSTEIAPWTVIEANDKRYARVKVVKTVADALEKALKPGD
jgi:AMP-polyphosphate phosphotransferase